MTWSCANLHFILFSRRGHIHVGGSVLQEGCHHVQSDPFHGLWCHQRNSCNPWGHWLMVFWNNSGSSTRWWYSLGKSKVLNAVEPFRSAINSSMVGIGCFSLRIAWFASLISTYISTSPFFLSTAILGHTHGLGPSAFSMMWKHSNLSNCFSISFRMWKGIRRWRC